MIEYILQKLGPFKGKYRLARWLLRKKIQHSKDVYVNGKYGCRYLLPNITENIGFEIYVDGVYEDEHLKLIIEKLPPHSVFIDIGANIGTIAIPVGKLRPDVNCLCVEASGRIFSYLKKNVELNALRNLNLYQNAVSDINDAEVGFYSPDLKYGKGSMSNVFTDKAEFVKTITLDKLASQCPKQSIGLIKVDVEGFECSVFKGGRNLLESSDAPDILFEFVDWAENSSGLYKAGDAQSLLLSMGYKLYKLDKGRQMALQVPLRNDFAMIFATKKQMDSIIH